MDFFPSLKLPASQHVRAESSVYHFRPYLGLAVFLAARTCRWFTWAKWRQCHVSDARWKDAGLFGDSRQLQCAQARENDMSCNSSFAALLKKIGQKVSLSPKKRRGVCSPAWTLGRSRAKKKNGRRAHILQIVLVAVIDAARSPKETWPIVARCSERAWKFEPSEIGCSPTFVGPCAYNNALVQPLLSVYSLYSARLEIDKERKHSVDIHV